MYRKSNYSKTSRPVNKTEIPDKKDAVRPTSDRTPNLGIDRISRSGLPIPGSSISVLADPYAIALPKSDPYALLNRQNVRAGGRYGGKVNIDGGLTNQLISSSSSNFLHVFDSMLMRARVNYRYLPIVSSDTNRGKGFVRQMINAIDEIISIAKSTTYTQLAINQYYIKTDLPIDGVSDYNKEYSCGDSNGLYALLIVYQCYLQAFASGFNYFNKFRANQGVMLSSSWDRETPQLNSWFSLVNKNSMINQWKSLAYLLNGEYFDNAWMRQFNLISSLISRKSNSMYDPILEMVCTHSLPKFSLYVKGLSGGTSTTTVILDSDTIDNTVKSYPNEKFANLTFQQLTDELAMKLSINDTLYWVRNSTAYSNETEQDRFTFISNYVDVVTIISGLFKPAMGDLRTMLDTLSRTGVVNWSKSVTLEVLNQLDVPPLYNLTLADMFQTLLSGASSMSYDTTTHRWSTATPWDYWNGIPAYDNQSGGSFLTFSLKTLPTVSGSQGDYIPILINGFISSQADRGGYVYAINRLGTSVELKKATFKASVNATTARLNPLGFTDFSIQCPYTSANLSVLDRSFLMTACLKVFGIFSNGSSNSISASTDLAMSPDLFCFITVEIEDLQNELLTYARTQGPFRVNTNSKSELGFMGLT